MEVLTMLDDEALRSIERRRDKAIAVILRTKEDECDRFLPSDVSSSFRKKILDEINEYHEVSMEILKFSLGSSVVNDVYIEKLVELLGRLEQKIG